VTELIPGKDQHPGKLSGLNCGTSGLRVNKAHFPEIIATSECVQNDLSAVRADTYCIRFSGADRIKRGAGIPFGDDDRVFQICPFHSNLGQDTDFLVIQTGKQGDIFKNVVLFQ